MGSPQHKKLLSFQLSAVSMLVHCASAWQYTAGMIRDERLRADR
jgi:hypothetical protein